MIAIGIIAILLVTGIGVGVAASNNDSGDKGIDIVDGEVQRYTSISRARPRLSSVSTSVKQ